MCQLLTLETQLSKFWEIEEIAYIKPNSAEEIECETHFANTTSRDSTGRYTVRLPFRRTNERLGDSRTVAHKRLLAVERKLNANDLLKVEYARAMKEYLTLGHMSIVESPGNDGYYMSHHAVIKESSRTTKVRVVFDASAKTSRDISLNDILMVGPTIQKKLFAHLIRFRMYRFVVTVDIEKMYRQVMVYKEDRKYQQILWRINDEIKTFQLNTLTFGVSSSPFLAIRTLHHLADDECHAYPRAAEIIKKHLYVDDLLTGADTIEEARAIRNEIIALLKRGGFIIRQWASNEMARRFKKERNTRGFFNQHRSFVKDVRLDLERASRQNTLFEPTGRRHRENNKTGYIVRNSEDLRSFRLNGSRRPIREENYARRVAKRYSMGRVSPTKYTHRLDGIYPTIRSHV